MRETTMAIYGFDGFVLRKMFWAIFYLLCDVTGPNGLVSPVGGPHSLRGVVGTAVMRNCRKTGVYNVQQ